jgi:hypothetical protein
MFAAGLGYGLFRICTLNDSYGPTSAMLMTMSVVVFMVGLVSEQWPSSGTNGRISNTPHHGIRILQRKNKMSMHGTITDLIETITHELEPLALIIRADYDDRASASSRRPTFPAGGLHASSGWS